MSLVCLILPSSDNIYPLQGQGGCAAEGESAAGEQHPRDRGHEPQDEGEPGRAAQVSSDWRTAGHVTAIRLLIGRAAQVHEEHQADQPQP